MPQSLSIKCEWIDQPAAQDPLEQRTWADVRLYVEGRAMTRVWDRRTQEERTSIFVPVFPLVRWIVHNWWSLLYETCRWEEVPNSSEGWVTAERRKWLRRHCLRAADSGILLPRLCLFSDGQRECLDFLADPPNVYSHMPAEFMESQRFWLPRDAVIEALQGLVRATIERLADFSSPLVRRLTESWLAIVQADEEEREFCRRAGQLGRDPYLAHEWSPSVLEFLESGIGANSSCTLASDFLDALEEKVDPRSVWRSLEQTRMALRVGESPSTVAMTIDDRCSPAVTGYRLAREFREKLGIGSSSRVVDVRRTIEVLGCRPMLDALMPTLSTPKIKAFAGWTDNGDPILAKTSNIGPQNLRFLEARAIFLAGYQCQNGPRLVSTVHTWSQKASRAFAAELLAPQSEILDRWERGDQSPAQIEGLAREFDVSGKVIEHQLQNAGACAMDD